MRFKSLGGRRPSPAMVIAIAALVAALAGTATAASLITSKQIKNGTIRNKDVHKRTLTANRLTKKTVKSLKGQRGAPGTPGTPGLGRGFATVNADGTVDETKSSAGISDGNVTKSGNFYCFNNLGFTPKVAVGNIDSNFAVGYTLQTNTQNTAGACPGAEQASAVQANQAGTTQSGVRFYIVFY